MDNSPMDKRPARQWRILITEGAHPNVMRVDLSWRTFPCKSLHWDGNKYTQFVHTPFGVNSAEDLRTVLVTAVDGEWYDGVGRGSPPPRT